MYFQNIVGLVRRYYGGERNIPCIITKTIYTPEFNNRLFDGNNSHIQFIIRSISTIVFSLKKNYRFYYKNTMFIKKNTLETNLLIENNIFFLLSQEQ